MMHFCSLFGFLQGKCLSIAEQVNMFNQTVQMELSRHYNSSELSDHLSKSIFLVAIGNNDYINNYLQPSFYNTSRTYSPTSFAKLIVDALAVQFQVELVIRYNN